MSKLVAHMKKFKKENLNGLGRHDQRRNKNYKNSEIDLTRTHRNIDLKNGTNRINFSKDIERLINQNKTTKRKIGKNAVMVCEWVISSDYEFFEGKTRQEILDYFQKSMDYFAKKHGEENIAYAIVHLDETTPHMHMGVLPITADGRLSARDCFNKKALKEIQTELPEFLQRFGHDIERGEEGSLRKHLTIEEFKTYQDQKKLLQNQINQQKKSVRQLTGIKENIETKNKDLEKRISVLKMMEVKAKEDLSNAKREKLQIEKMKDAFQIAQQNLAREREMILREREALAEEKNEVEAEINAIKQYGNEQKISLTAMQQKLIETQGELEYLQNKKREIKEIPNLTLMKFGYSDAEKFLSEFFRMKKQLELFQKAFSKLSDYVLEREAKRNEQRNQSALKSFLAREPIQNEFKVNEFIRELKQRIMATIESVQEVKIDFRFNEQLYKPKNTPKKGINLEAREKATEQVKNGLRAKIERNKQQIEKTSPKKRKSRGLEL